jgi:tetratricopeptide (TPR) repeat protein
MAYNNRGAAYLNLGEYEKAIADLDQAIELDPEYALAYNHRGAAYFSLGEYEKAIADYDRAIELDPEYAMAYNNRGYAYLNLGEYEKAIADWDQAIELDPELAMAYNNRGYAYLNLGEYEKAIADLDQAIELDPELAMAYGNRGAAYLSLGEYEKAIADCDQAIALDPELAMAYNNRGAAYLNLGEYEKAIADLDQAIALDPELAMAYNNRGAAYLNLGEYEKAIADYERVLALTNNPSLRQMAERKSQVLKARIEGKPYQGSIKIGEQVTDELTELHETHDWTFQGQAGQEVTIRCAPASGADTDPYLTLVGPDRQILAEDDDGGGGYTALISNFVLPDDLTYTIQVNVWKIGAYDLSLTESHLEETEQPDDEEKETTISLQTYEHPDGVFTLNYPEGWEAVAQEGIVMFGNLESQTKGQMILVVYGSTEQLFESSASESLSEVANQMAADFWEDVGEYDVAAEEQISEERVYLSTLATDQSFIVDIYTDQMGDVAFVLLLTSMPDSDFHQAWDAIIESYTVHPETIP